MTTAASAGGRLAAPSLTAPASGGSSRRALANVMNRRVWPGWQPGQADGARMR